MPASTGEIFRLLTRPCESGAFRRRSSENELGEGMRPMGGLTGKIRQNGLQHINFLSFPAKTNGTKRLRLSARVRVCQLPSKVASPGADYFG
jgi:hypothetical protein